RPISELVAEEDDEATQRGFGLISRVHKMRLTISADGNAPAGADALARAYRFAVGRQRERGSAAGRGRRRWGRLLGARNLGARQQPCGDQPRRRWSPTASGWALIDIGYDFHFHSPSGCRPGQWLLGS